MAKATRNQYKGITFEENYSRTFDQFKKEFENTHVFKKIPEKERLAELKKAFKIATNTQLIKKEDILTPEILKEVENIQKEADKKV
jgi:hypothetical protein